MELCRNYTHHDFSSTRHNSAVSTDWPTWKAMPWLQGRPEATTSLLVRRQWKVSSVVYFRAGKPMHRGLVFSSVIFGESPRPVEYLEEAKFIPHAEWGCVGQAGFKLPPGGGLTDWPAAKPNSRHTLQPQKNQYGKQSKLSTTINQQNSPQPLADLLDRIKTQNSVLFCFSKSLAME